MNKFSKSSLKQLKTCHKDLQRVFNEVIKYHDCTIIQGHRTKQEQNDYFRTGKSKVQYPNSKHNSYPSNAIDVAPYIKGIGIPWNDKEYFYFFAGFVKCIAEQLNVNIRWGGDWDSDGKLKDQSFFDLPHWEIRD